MLFLLKIVLSILEIMLFPLKSFMYQLEIMFLLKILLYILINMPTVKNVVSFENLTELTKSMLFLLKILYRPYWKSCCFYCKSYCPLLVTVSTRKHVSIENRTVYMYTGNHAVALAILTVY